VLIFVSVFVFHLVSVDLTVKIFVSVTVWVLAIQAVAEAVKQLQALETAVAFILWYEAVFFAL